MDAQPTLLSVTTFAALLDRLAQDQPGRPLLTFYDGRSGERTELSVTTYANWVAKTASLLVEECDLERGDRLLLDLPAHWLGPVFLGAAWTIGLEVVWDGEPDAVACGPDALPAWAERATALPVVATALLPLAARFPEGVAAGVRDLGVEVWAQPDAFTPYDLPGPADPAVGALSQADLWASAARGHLLENGGRLLSRRNPASASGLWVFAEPFARAGSLVLLVGSADDDALAASERVSARDA
jgi:uncharacterized protein (TIGR03089 family)